MPGTLRPFRRLMNDPTMTQDRPRLIIPFGTPALPDQAIEVLRGLYEIVSEAPGGDGQPRPGDIMLSAYSPENRALDQAFEAIDEAGVELIRIDAEMVATQNTVQRLRRLEQLIVTAVRELMQFDHFEIRLTNRETDQLELVIAVGLPPLKVGEVIYARQEENGISGFVATTGRSYICPNVGTDPRYTTGLENAGSSLTVPLKLHQEVIGVFNIESKSPDAFGERDRILAERFARHIALALHVLDLMVKERYITRSQTGEELLEETQRSLATISESVATLRPLTSDLASAGELLDEVEAAAERAREQARICTMGPRSLLGAEQTLHTCRPDPVLTGKRVLVADDDELIRNTIRELLQRSGCEVVICDNGLTTIEMLEREDENEPAPFDLVLSDVRMPDRNGYEVFRAAKAKNPDLPVILMTGFGYDPHHSIVRASQEGLHCFLFKPFRASQLIEEIGKALTKPE